MLRTPQSECDNLITVTLSPDHWRNRKCILFFLDTAGGRYRMGWARPPRVHAVLQIMSNEQRFGGLLMNWAPKSKSRTSNHSTSRGKYVRINWEKNRRNGWKRWQIGKVEKKTGISKRKTKRLEIYGSRGITRTTAFKQPEKNHIWKQRLNNVRGDRAATGFGGGARGLWSLVASTSSHDDPCMTSEPLRGSLSRERGGGFVSLSFHPRAFTDDPCTIMYIYINISIHTQGRIRGRAKVLFCSFVFLLFSTIKLGAERRRQNLYITRVSYSIYIYTHTHISRRYIYVHDPQCAHGLSNVTHKLPNTIECFDVP